ncbi:ABC transporter permease [Corynebacterium lubricantis]|uniref:ABC transporter permease n=1 Tax=Corynebacterium lubricantis TaxID=541095 RepID=UPI00038239FF|nr:ABC transporter permease [Corynebacterium lubricantis]
MSQTSYSSANTIATVAKREIQMALRSKGIMVTVSLLLIGIIISVGVVAYFTSRDSGPTTVATVEIPASAFEGSDLQATQATDRAEAEALVLSGDVDAGVVPSDSGWEVLSDGAPSTTVLGSVSAIAMSYSVSEAITSLGLSPEEYAAAMPPSQVTPVDLSSNGDSATQNLTAVLTALVGILIVAFTVILFAANIGGRITEEKSSRVVEIILAAVRPMDFLTGKILGNVIFGFFATAVVIAAGVVTLAVSGLLDGIEFDWAILPILLVAWILGMFFFGSLYAAAGAMVQRTEDLNSTQTPVLMLIMVAMYIPMFGWSMTDTLWMQILSWIPPFSIFTAPITYATGDMTLVQLIASQAIALLAVVGVIWFVARVYRATILYNGRRMSWLQAVRA